MGDGQFRYFKIMEHSRESTAECVQPVPLRANLLRFGDNDIPDQMTEVDWACRVIRRVKDVSRSSISLKVRVEIFLHNSDDWHGGLAAYCLRILHKFAMHDGPFDVENLLLAVVVSPPKSLQFLRPHTSERSHHETRLRRLFFTTTHQPMTFFPRIYQS